MEREISKVDIYKVVASAVAEVVNCQVKDVSNATKLPEERQHLMVLVLEHTDNPGFCPYTGEAKTVGQLVEALTVPDSKLKWKEASGEGRGSEIGEKRV